MLWRTFGAKCTEACFKAASHFMHKHKYIYPQKMNKTTCTLQKVYDKVWEFMEHTCLLLFGSHCDQSRIFNMDQKPLYFSHHSSKTLVKHGSKTVHVRKTSNGTKRAKGVLTVPAASIFLTSTIIFKGKLNGTIAKREPPLLDPTSIYACQDASWMDKRCMLI